MGGTCSTNTALQWEKVRARDQFGNLGADEEAILTCILKKWDRGLDWIDPNKDRGRQHALVATVMNLQVP